MYVHTSDGWNIMKMIGQTMDNLEDRLSKSWFDLCNAEDELYEILSCLGDFDDCHHDYYDESFEVVGVDPEARLTQETLRLLWSNGFKRGWLNHDDGTETYYSVMFPKGTTTTPTNPRTQASVKRKLRAHLHIEALRKQRDELADLLGEARFELSHYEKDDCGYSNSTVLGVIDDIDAALKKLKETP